MTNHAAELPTDQPTNLGRPAPLTSGPLVVAVLGKGGEGKTTSTASIGDALAHLTGWPVTLVDLDAQASLTNWLAPTLAEDARTVDDVLAGHAQIADVIRQVRFGLSLVPVANGLASIETTLDPHALADRVIVACAKDSVVVLDTPATRPLGPGAKILRAALDAADIAVVPFRATAMSLDAVAETLAQIRAHEKLADRVLPTFLLPTQTTRDGAEPLVSRALRLGGLTVLPPVPASSWAGKAAAERVLLAERSPAGAAIRLAYDEVAAALVAPLLTAAEA